MNKRTIRMIIYYIIGFLIYMAALYLVQTAILSIIGLTRDNFQYVLFDNIIINVILYTTLYAIIYGILWLYDRWSVKVLNEKLNQMKERVKTNEEAILGYGYNNSYNSSSAVRYIWDC